MNEMVEDKRKMDAEIAKFILEKATEFERKYSVCVVDLEIDLDKPSTIDGSSIHFTVKTVLDL